MLPARNEPSGRGLAVLREERQFRLLFLGQALSIVGDRITQIVLPFAVLSIGGSITDVGIVAASGTVPFILLGLIGGVLADRVERKRILIASDLVRLLVQLIAGLLLVSGHAQVWHLALLTAVFGAADSFFSPAFSGLQPLTISQPHFIQPANALRGMTFSTGSLVGPALGAALVATVGEGGALLADAGTFAVSVTCLLLLRPRTVERGDPEPFGADLRGGWREVRARRWVWTFLLGMIVYHMIVLPSIFVLGPVLMRDEYSGATSWAIVTAAFGAGSIAGDVLVLRWHPRYALRVAAVALALGSCQAVIIGSGLTILLIAAVEFVAAIGVSVFFTLWETSLQEHIPESKLSRVSSYDYAASAGMMPIGMLVAPPVADAIGIHLTLTLMSVCGIAAAALCLSVRAVRDLPRGAAVRGTAAPAPAAP